MNRTEKVLITGGSGMTGRYLTSWLIHAEPGRRLRAALPDQEYVR